MLPRGQVRAQVGPPAPCAHSLPQGAQAALGTQKPAWSLGQWHWLGGEAGVGSRLPHTTYLAGLVHVTRMEEGLVHERTGFPTTCMFSSSNGFYVQT